MTQIRMDKLLALSGDRSRSEAAKLIRQGCVTVDAVSVSDPALKVDAETSVVLLHGQRVWNRPYQYIMLHKPVGLLTAARDSRADTIMNLLPKSVLLRQVMPVGRLDKDTTGLLLLSNDGQLSHRLLAPKTHVWKEYIATVDGLLDARHEAAFTQGITLSDFTALPAQMTIQSASAEESRALVRLREGKYHQVKRMFLSFGLQVTALHRQSFGPLRLDIPCGEYRTLRDAEIKALYTAAGMEEERSND